MFNSTKKNDNPFSSNPGSNSYGSSSPSGYTGKENTETTIGSACVIKGTISNPSAMKFHGYLEGSLTCGDHVMICKEAVIDGDVEADAAVLYGKVKGTIRADKVELKSAAQIDGDIETYTFDMEKGAFFNGKIKMLKPEEKISKKGSLIPRSQLEKEKDKSSTSTGASSTGDNSKSIPSSWKANDSAAIFGKKK